MHFVDARILVQHECPFCEFSMVFPEAQMGLWCNRSNEIFQINAPNAERLEEILQAAKEYLSAREIFSDGHSALSIIRDCHCAEGSSVTTIADGCGAWLVPPTTYLGGWETHRVFAPGKETLQRLISEIKKIGKVKLLSKRPRRQLDVVLDLGVVPVHFFEGMTDKQIHALVTAYESGLFDVPARENLDKVAEREGVSRSTFGEHLRKAEMKILRNSYPFLKLRDAEKQKR